MTEPSDLTIRTRARLADALAGIVEADPCVRRWRRLNFAEDGGALLVVELRDRRSKEVVKVKPEDVVAAVSAARDRLRILKG